MNQLPNLIIWVHPNCYKVRRILRSTFEAGVSKQLKLTQHEGNRNFCSYSMPFLPAMSLRFTANLPRDKFDCDTEKLREHLFKLTATENISVVNWFIFKFTQKSFKQPPCSIDVVASQYYGLCPGFVNPIYNRSFPKHPAIYDHHLSFFSSHSTHKSSLRPDLLLCTLVPQGFIK